jgi:hypothetical protein
MAMTVHFIHAAVPPLHRRLNREVPHRLALVVLTLKDSYAYALVGGKTGGCVAWDGMYSADTVMPIPATTPLDELDLDERDDMASKLVFRAQADWLAGLLGFRLMPSYSVAKEAAELMCTLGLVAPPVAPNTMPYRPFSVPR